MLDLKLTNNLCHHIKEDVIDASLQEFDIQAQKGLGSIAQSAIQSGAFGGGREGVARAEYMSASDRNRAALQAQLLQQGFGQAQQAAGQAFGQQQALSQQQQALAALSPQLAGQQVAGLTSLGGGLQSQRQAELGGAQQQLAQQQLMQPLQSTQALGFRYHESNRWIPWSTTNNNFTIT